MLTRGQPRTTVGVTAAASEAHWRTIYGNTRQWKPDEDLVSWMNDMQQTIPAQQLDPIKDHKIGAMFDLSDPANYRPIACLNTCYKLITGMAAAWIKQHLTEHSILPKEQLALVEGKWVAFMQPLSTKLSLRK
uniref:Uncharacterized protein n=1 Tax=Ditylenchus dipsaci TaxID=166011 RepID=A0A915EVA4_9BILA